MLLGVDPLVHAIESLPENGCYSVTFTLTDGQQRVVVVRARDGSIDMPPANVAATWSAQARSYQAALAAVTAFDSARRLVEPEASCLRDVDGGWDVSLGNIVLDADRRPACIAHGELESVGGDRYRCVECGAVAAYS